jgi:hypothetical protein
MAKTRTRLTKNSTVAEWVKIARAEGWSVKRNASGHLQFYPPEGPFVTISANPNAGRSLANDRARLKRNGLPIPDNAGNLPKLPETPSWQDFVNDDDLSAAKARMIIDSYPHEDYKECPCGKSFATAEDAILHRVSCDGADHLYRNAGPDEYPPGGSSDMERDPKKPPDRDRLKCPECGFFVWNTQPHLLEKHIANQHPAISPDRVPCEWCGKMCVPTKGLLRHQNRCPKNPYIELVPREGRPARARGVPRLVARPVRKPPTVTVATEQQLENAAAAIEPEPLRTITGELNPVHPAFQATVPGVPRIPGVPQYHTYVDKHGTCGECDRPIGSWVHSQHPPDVIPEPVEPVIVLSDDPSEDELWALMELVLDKPVMLDRDTLRAVTAWMDATRELLKLRQS